MRATLAFAVVGISCASPTALQTARTLPKDEIRAGVAIEAYRGPDALGTDPAPPAWQPQVELFARAGITDRVDCGFKVWILFARGDCKLELVRSRWLDAAFGGGAAISLSHGAYLGDLYAPLYVDLNV